MVQPCLMTTEQFCYWLRGLLELGDVKSLTVEQTKMVREHLATVFHKVTPPTTRGADFEPAPSYIPSPLELVDKVYCSSSTSEGDEVPRSVDLSTLTISGDDVIPMPRLRPTGGLMGKRVC